MSDLKGGGESKDSLCAHVAFKLAKALMKYKPGEYIYPRVLARLSCLPLGTVTKVLEVLSHESDFLKEEHFYRCPVCMHEIEDLDGENAFCSNCMREFDVQDLVTCTCYKVKKEYTSKWGDHSAHKR